MSVDYAAKQERRGSRAKECSGEPVSASTQGILVVQPMETQCISVLLADTHLKKRFANIAGEGYCMESSPKEYFPELIL